ncbi:uncharacterized protein LOC115052416 [Echeneis naucrates]|uniref:uncharacterized protein LOC115052416 n=1 Tax=Echeneis naucrates TaxID=173247 RepID=UPI001113EF65|nr:uncharacterized protein LOC115052416 [Echeneis naucrates]
MKSFSMMASQVLQLSLLLAALCEAHHALTEDTSTLEDAGEVPISQLRMLSLGLAHLLHGVERNMKQLDQQGEQVATELDGATRSLESLHKQSLQAGRTRKQVRRDLQILSARGDKLWTAVKELQSGLEGLQTEQRAMEHWMNQVLQRVKRLTEPRPRGQTQLGTGFMKLTVEKQALQLATLASVVSAQDRLIDRRLRRIEHLEKQVSDRVPAALREDTDSNCV